MAFMPKPGIHQVSDSAAGQQVHRAPPVLIEPGRQSQTFVPSHAGFAL